jgi:hypothetical protein
MTNDIPTSLLKRPTNESLRSREYLLPDEVERLLLNCAAELRIYL